MIPIASGNFDAHLPRRKFLQQAAVGAATFLAATTHWASGIPGGRMPLMKRSAELRRELLACLGGNKPTYA